MKIEMKKVFLFLIFAFFSVQNNYGQGNPPTPPVDCATCDELEEAGDQDGAEACRIANGCTTGVPINSNILLLFTTAIALGGYSFINPIKKDH